MDVSAQPQSNHAQVMRARTGVFPAQALPQAHIVESWSRSMQAGLHFSQPVPQAVVLDADLRRRRDKAAFVRRLAQAELETLGQQIAGSNFLLAFADPEGVILDLYADNRFAMSGDDAGIVAGSCWTESVCGTNGLGTALASGQPVSVSGPEHYLVQLGRISCTAAPVRDAAGELVGVLDASSYFESRQHHTQALVRMAATQMENALLVHQMRQHLILAIHPRAEFLGTLSAGLMAFDEGGELKAANARARQLLQGLQLLIGSSFETLFGERFGLAVARLNRGGEIGLRDLLGSALLARCIGRAAPRAVAPGLTVTPKGMPPRAAKPSLAPEVVADDPAVVDAFERAQAAVRLRAPILIQGETGTGKEVLARHAHRTSGRAGPFVAVNCGALPDELFEAELFGYVGGAFTGARREGSAGLIASADGGTLLLDEIGDLPLHLQAALLRFLDDGVVRQVGGTNARRVDVQLLAATNTDLDDAVAARRFRADLLYRLNTIRIDMPPLRRRHDFAASVRSVLRVVDSAASIDDGAIERLSRHSWPGNFRELRSVLTRALLLEPGRRLHQPDFEALLPAAALRSSGLAQLASDAIRREFERCGRSVSRTSRSLGISRTTVYRHLEAGQP
jgi:sigma-54 dependent transcriptional regulator, acetoin dehydrogenase operon transcriptional activator AcoR